MARTLRLSDAAETALDRITAVENISANAAINEAVLEYDAKRREIRDSMLRQLVEEDKALLDRLA